MLIAGVMQIRVYRPAGCQWIAHIFSRSNFAGNLPHGLLLYSENAGSHLTIMNLSCASRLSKSKEDYVELHNELSGPLSTWL
jgi:hypothetical protein